MLVPTELGFSNKEEAEVAKKILEEFASFCNGWTEEEGRRTIGVSSGIPNSLTQKLLRACYEMVKSDKPTPMAGMSLACQFGIFLGLRMAKKGGN